MTTDQPDIFKDRLRAARELKGMSQSELAATAKLPASSIAHFESGARKPSFDNLRRLGIALMVTTDYLLGRVDIPDMAGAGDPLFRHMANISGADRPLAEEMLRLLAERNQNRRKDEP
ncbi:helix-turn-helix domain-containing protein [Roseicella aquatilis]|uniref:XRE family transcriptional regulator n=1 Tax=Roseicella aquatilis TaxID=2527868 RepID=A0A4R4D7I8_9PROT|nr:helix-turn-helix transcriptional regulator [Roseicella aquatilis]TCZ55753.1 XRE family transcriptional regulator [Roseicella aquatilis]